jgi:IMP dehydrogenase
MDKARQLEEVFTVSLLSPEGHPVAAAIGANGFDAEHVRALVKHGVSVIVIDVAHGHHAKVADTIRAVKSLELIALDGLPVEVIAGNVASELGVRFLAEFGADAIKVGIGSGSICSTRIVTGHGFPQLSALAYSAQTAEMLGVPLISDGGIRSPGDIVKSLAVGASSVMLGSILAGTEEAPGEMLGGHGFGPLRKLYRGMASREAQAEFFGNSPEAPEGVTISIPYKGSISPILKELIAGINSGLSYSGARTIDELQKKADWIRVSSAGVVESRPIT